MVRSTTHRPVLLTRDSVVRGQLVRVPGRSWSERRGGRVTSLGGARRTPNGDPMHGPSLLFSLPRSRQRTGPKDASVGRTRVGPKQVARITRVTSVDADRRAQRQVATHTRFSDQSQFSHHVKRLVGVTPGQVRTPARI